MDAYHFTDDWYVGAEPDVVRALLRRTDGWPGWWPSCVSVEPVPPRATGAREAARYTFATRLAYRMQFQADVLLETATGVDTVVVGRVLGRGSWRVIQVPGGCRLHFAWTVVPQVAWMRALAPLARPIFVWNHQALMAEGAWCLAERLGVGLLRPPACRPSVAAATGRVVIAVVLTAVSAASVRWAFDVGLGCRRDPRRKRGRAWSPTGWLSGGCS